MSWNVRLRLAVPMPSICTTTNPSSAIDCMLKCGEKLFGTNDPCGPA
jgi:hypothetical protein